MTAFDRFDPFDQRIAAAFEDIAAGSPPDYLDDVFGVTARTSQRPRWSFPERWLPMDLTARQPFFGRFALRPLVLFVVLALLALAATAVWIGREGPQRLPAPFGPADNGQLVFGMSGDLYAIDTVTSQPRLLVDAEGDQGGVVNSPDGQLIAYDNIVDDVDHVFVANADGSNPHRILDHPFTGLGATWSPDSRSMALVTEDGESHQLWLAAADGSGARGIDLGEMRPWDAVWDPQREGVMLVRAEDRQFGLMDLYYVDTNGKVLSMIDMSTGHNLNGPAWEYSGVAFSPDGKTIAYNAVETMEPPFNRFRVHVMNRDGTNDRAIPAPLEIHYSQAWPVFSPDGKTIAMESWETGTDGTPETRISRLAVAAADGSAIARWIGPSEIGQTFVKTWSPDGTYILLGMRERGAVFVLDPDTGEGDRLPWAIDLPDVQRVRN